MTALVDRVGHAYGELFVLGRVENHKGRARWRCFCMQCGNETTASGSDLVTGNKRSCGCLQRLTAATTPAMVSKASPRFVHGRTGSPIHSVWHNMIERCTRPTDKEYARYGGRGITVCDRWREPDGQGFVNFLADLGEKPAGCDLHRIDNNRGYEPGNVEWLSKSAHMRHHNAERKRQMVPRYAFA